MSEQQGIDWQHIARELTADFPPDRIEWRPQGKTGPNMRVQLVPYIDARDVQERLDSVVGAGGWYFDWQPLNIDAKGEVTSAKGILTLHGLSKSDVGTASHFEPSKGSVSDALKRAAVMWGIGRYIYSLPAVWVTLDAKGYVTDEALAKLRQGLERRQSRAAQPAPAAQPAAQPEQREQAQEQREQAPTPAPAARPQAQAPVAQPNGRPFNPMSDVPFRNRCNAINLRMKNEVEDLVQGLYIDGAWDRDGCIKRLEAAEQRAKQPRAAVRA